MAQRTLSRADQVAAGLMRKIWSCLLPAAGTGAGTVPNHHPRCGPTRGYEDGVVIRRKRPRTPGWFGAEANPRRRELREFAELRTQERSQRRWPIDHEFVYL